MLTNCMVFGIPFISLCGGVASKICYGVQVSVFSAKKCFPHENDDGTLSIAAIFGIVLGSIFGLVFVIFLCICVYACCRDCCAKLTSCRGYCHCNCRKCRDKVGRCFGNCNCSCKKCRDKVVKVPSYKGRNAVTHTDHTTEAADDKELPITTDHRVYIVHTGLAFDTGNVDNVH